MPQPPDLPAAPPGPPSEPFPLTRTPPGGTLVGLAAPLHPAAPPERLRGLQVLHSADAPPPAPTVVRGRWHRAPLLPPPLATPGQLAPAEAPPGSELAPLLESVRVELVYFRRWLPEQLAGRAAPTSVAPAAPVPPRAPASARPRARQRQALALGAGAALALLTAFVSGAAALSWPAYGRLVARAAHIGTPSAPAAAR